MSRSIEWLSSFLSFFFFSLADSPFLHFSRRQTDERARSLGADTQVHHEEEGACQVVVAGPPLAGWLPRHSSVNFNVLCHDLSRVSARLSPRFGRSSLPLFTLPLLPSSPVVVSLVRSLALSISRGSHFSFKPHTMRQMNRICETRGSGFGG